LQYDTVLGCIDNLESRLYLNAYCCYYKIPYIDGSTDSTNGKVQVIVPPITPCLECYTNKTHAKIVNLKFSCNGDRRVFYQLPLGAEITTTSIIAGVQVREALKIASRKYKMVIKNIFYYDGLQNISEVVSLHINPNCMHHFSYRTRNQ
jgi:molybdopterin/thiamine biosynthesis adenylyltransferase